jgi:hypothetical protein
MIKFLVILSVILSINITCSAQEILFEDLRKSYSELNAKFLNQKSFLKDRVLAFKKINKININDSLIFIENFIDELDNYSCSFYFNSKLRCFKSDHYYGKFHRKTNIIETHLCGISDYLIRNIRKGNLDEILEKGKKSGYTPTTVIIITIAFYNERKELIINSYKLCKFVID